MYILTKYETKFKNYFNTILKGKCINVQKGRKAF